MKKRIANIPDWLSAMPDKTNLGSRDVARIFGLDVKSATRSAEAGTIPKPLFRTDGSMGFRTSGGWGAAKEKHYWTLGDIRRWSAE